MVGLLRQHRVDHDRAKQRQQPDQLQLSRLLRSEKDLILPDAPGDPALERGNREYEESRQKRHETRNVSRIATDERGSLVDSQSGLGDCLDREGRAHRGREGTARLKPVLASTQREPKLMRRHGSPNELAIEPPLDAGQLPRALHGGH